MSEYITLQHATKFCPYTQEYLSLRARQGKLKALKLGRNWVCTKEWLQEYIVKSEEYKNSLASSKPGFSMFKAGLPPYGRSPEGRQTTDPPRNLPIYAPDAEMWEDEIPEDIARQKEFQRKFQFAFATSLVVALLFVSVFQGREQVFTVGGKASDAVISFAVSLQDTAQEKGFALGSEAQLYFSAGIGEIARGYAAWLGEYVRSIAKIFVPEPPTQQADSRTREESRGLVVVPSSADEADDEKLKEEIKRSFSDEVNVIPYDEESGIITPVFRERRDEDYLYILVPLHNAK